VRSWHLVINAAVLEKWVKSFERHFWAVLGESNFIKNADRGKSESTKNV
jgi:hypothetical protein